MVKKKGVYKCDSCGVVTESLWDGVDSLYCCEKEMKELVPNTTDAAVEKHVPVVEWNGNRVTVTVGSAAHPMTKEHYILFVELLAGDKVFRQDFKEGDAKAEASFLIEECTAVTARAYCNLHGFWKSK